MRSWTTLLFLLAFPLSAGAGDLHESWAGLWRLTQNTDKGPVPLFLHVEAREKATLYSADWDELVLVDWKLGPDSVFLNWQTKGFNVAFRGNRREESVEGIWELVHPQYHMRSSFDGVRLLSRASWRPFQNSDPQAMPDFLDLSRRLIEHWPDLTDYWQQTFYPDYLPLLQDAPSPEQLSDTLDQPAVSERAREFARIGENLATHLKRLGVQLPCRIVALPFGPEQPHWVRVGDSQFLLTNSSAMLDDPPGRQEGKIALALLRAIFEQYHPTARVPSMEVFRSGMPIYLWVRAYSKPLEEPMGVSDARLKQLEAELGELKRRAQAHQKLEQAEWAVLGYHFLQHLAESRPLPTLVELSVAEIDQAFRDFLEPSRIREKPAARR